MKLQQSESTVTTLANAGELVRNIVQEVVGNEVADTIEGNPITRDLIQGVAQVKFQGAVSKYLTAGAK